MYQYVFVYEAINALSMKSQWVHRFKKKTIKADGQKFPLVTNLMLNWQLTNLKVRCEASFDLADVLPEGIFDHLP